MKTPPFNVKKNVLVCFLFLLFFILFFVSYVGVPYKTIVYENTPMSNRGLYSYQLGTARLLFSADVNLVSKIEGMIPLHLNSFWEAERCAAMTTSIFKNTAFFIDTKNEISPNGEITKRNFIYRYDFLPSHLEELVAPLPVERVYKDIESGDYFALSKVTEHFVILFKINSGRNTLQLRSFYILPKTHNLLTKTNYLSWCNISSGSCINKESLLGYEDRKKIDSMVVNEDTRQFSNQGKTLFIKDNTKNVFLGY